MGRRGLQPFVAGPFAHLLGLSCSLICTNPPCRSRARGVRGSAKRQLPRASENPACRRCLPSCRWCRRSRLGEIDRSRRLRRRRGGALGTWNIRDGFFDGRGRLRFEQCSFLRRRGSCSRGGACFGALGRSPSYQTTTRRSPPVWGAGLSDEVSKGNWFRSSGPTLQCSAFVFGFPDNACCTLKLLNAEHSKREAKPCSHTKTLPANPVIEGSAAYQPEGKLQSSRRRSETTVHRPN